MYPNLTPTLVVLLALATGAALFIALRGPFLRRLALREVVRRRREATLVVLGSMLGTAIIVGSLIVGDTLNFSVKQAAYQHLGPIDEIVTSSDLSQGQQASDRLAVLRNDPSVDGILAAYGDLAAVARGSGSARVAEPRVAVWDLSFSDAAAFGSASDGSSGISGPGPGPGQVVINTDLASALRASAGDELTLYLYGSPMRFRVARVIPTVGVAGASIDGVANDAFLPPGTLVSAASSGQVGGASGSQALGSQPPAPQPRSFVFVSNAGGVESGNTLSDPVSRKIRSALGPLVNGTSVEKAKQDVLAAAKASGDTLGSLFLMIGSFAIIAGFLLLVNVFVMLAEGRKSELGMLRAIGMKRSRLVRSFVIEGTVYALVASLLGVAAGIGVGRAVGAIAARIFSGQSSGDTLNLVFHMTPVSLVNGFALGFLIALVTVALTSVRISRINIIAAIRDLPPEDRQMKRRWVIVSTILVPVFGALAAGAIAKSQGVGSYLFPALAAMCLGPLLLRVAPKRVVYSGVALAVLAWTLVASTVRPHLMDTGSNTTFMAIGILLTFSAVILVSQNQELVTAPLRPLVERASQIGLSTRLGIAYPLGKRFRTGVLLLMYGMVVFVLVFITTLSALVQGTVSRSVASASGGFGIRADFNPAAPIRDPSETLRSGSFAGKVGVVAPLSAAIGTVTDLNPLVEDPVRTVVVGIDPSIEQAGGFPLSKRSEDFETDQAAWEAALSDPGYAIVDNMLGQLDSGGPPQTLLYPGDTFTLTDPQTGASEQKTIVGILDSSYAFYGMGGGMVSPILVSQAAGLEQFGSGLRPAAALIQPASGVSDQALAAQLQGQFLPQGVVATKIRESVEQSFSSSRGFFELMQGFVALGLLVGIAGLGVAMIRAVRERRRSIGVLRALGFPARTVQRAFLTESLLIALEGVILGSVLSLVTTYQLFKSSDVFRTAQGGFSVPWLAIVVLGVVAIAASVLASAWPARQASHIQPAVALRIVD